MKHIFIRQKKTASTTFDKLGPQKNYSTVIDFEINDWNKGNN
jgi:hypothetical protein